MRCICSKSIVIRKRFVIVTWSGTDDVNLLYGVICYGLCLKIKPSLMALYIYMTSYSSRDEKVGKLNVFLSLFFLSLICYVMPHNVSLVQVQISVYSLTLFRMDFFGAAQGWGSKKAYPS